MTGELIPTGVTFGVGRNSINDAFSGTATLNNITLDSGGNLTAGVGGGIIQSGGTDLYNIFTTSDSTTAGNGLTKTGDNITLGGALTGTTTITVPGIFDTLSLVKTANTASVLTATDGTDVSAIGVGVVAVSDGTSSMGLSMDISLSGINYQDGNIGGGNQILEFNEPTSLTTHTISLPVDKTGTVALLSDITAGDITRVQPGTNIITGDTGNYPSVNLKNNISLTSVETTQGFSGGQDSNTTSYLGRTAVGYGAFSDYAHFSHVDYVSSTEYCLIQGPDGTTTINAPLSSNGIQFRLDNVNYMRISAYTGYVGIGQNLNQPTQRLHVDGSIRMEDGNEGYGKIPYDTGDGTMAWSAFTFGGTVTAGNGLTQTGDNITLGGTITGNTNIDTAGFDLTFSDTDVELLWETSTDVKKLQMSGNSNTLTQFSTSAYMPSLGGDGGITFGAIGETAVIGGLIPERGDTGDTFIYSSAVANGLNIISAAGTGTDDYIRFYAGQFANGTTPDLYIQGDGATRGYVGIKEAAPKANLDIGGDVYVSTSISATTFYSGSTDLISIIESAAGGVDAVNDYGNVSGNVDWDISGDSPNAKLRLIGNVTALNVINATSGTYGTMLVTQSTGSHTLALGVGTHKVANSGAGSITLTATAGASDILTFFYDGSVFYWNVGNDYT